jgi:ligand-binding sensor domain-containing protein
MDIISEQGFTLHSYANDMQIYVGVQADETVRAAQQFAVCIDRVNQWLASNRLKLNADKIQAVWIGTRQHLTKVDIKNHHLQTATVALSSTVSNLSVAIDCHMNMSKHIASLCRHKRYVTYNGYQFVSASSLRL